MTSYPVTLTAQALDMSGMAGVRAGMLAEDGEHGERTGVYADASMLEAAETMSESIKENNLTEFKKYLDDPQSEIHQYLGENGIVYSYGVNFKACSYDGEGVLVASDADPEDAGGSELEGQGTGGPMANMDRMSQMISGGSSGAENFVELLPGTDGDAVSPILTESYEVLYGAWPEQYDEVVLVLDEDNGIPADVLYQLGFVSAEEYSELTQAIKDGEEEPQFLWDYEEICGHSFYALPASALYKENEDGTFSYPDVVNVEQMCEMLGGICDKTAYRLLKSGKIKSFIVGRRYRIPKLNILEYLELIDKSTA